MIVDSVGTRGTDLGRPLVRAASLRPGALAVVSGERRLSYGDLNRRVQGLGTGLEALGVESGGRVGFLGYNSLAHFECWLGVPAHGRVMTDLNTRLAEDELAFLIDDSDTEVLIVGAEHLEIGRALARRCDSVRHLVFDDERGECPGDLMAYEDLVAGGPLEPDDVPEHTLAAISYTGGTTGRPKGVMLTHRNLVANALHNMLATRHEETDRFLHACPMFHASGITNVFASTWVGACNIILPRFDARAVLEAIERERATLSVFVPTMLAALVAELQTRQVDLRSLRNIHYAAAPISADLQRKAAEAFGCELAQMYGMTEAAPTVTHLTPDEHRRGVAGEEPFATRLTSVGRPVAGVEIDVRGPDGTSQSRGEVGEICVRGPNVTPGYWHQPDMTAEAFDRGWYRTGDAGYVDDGGYLFLVDRIKDMIVSGAENVYSIEVESVLLQHPHVKEAAVFGIPDDHWGETVHATVVLDAAHSVSEDELASHCRSSIAGFKVPRSFDLRTEPLPKSGAGKVLKGPLREPYWDDRDRRIN
jgi:long-chain acyl-CoA synthetase